MASPHLPQRPRDDSGEQAFNPSDPSLQPGRVSDPSSDRRVEIEKLLQQLWQLQMANPGEQTFNTAISLPISTDSVSNPVPAQHYDVTQSQGHIYQNTNVYGGTNFQGDNHGHIHNYYFNNSTRSARSVMDNNASDMVAYCHGNTIINDNSAQYGKPELNDDDSVHSSVLDAGNQAWSLTSDIQLLENLRSLVNLAAATSASFSSIRANRCKQLLVDVLKQIRFCPEIFPPKLNGTTPDSLHNLLDKITSIFQLSPQLTMVAPEEYKMLPALDVNSSQRLSLGDTGAASQLSMFHQTAASCRYAESTKASKLLGSPEIISCRYSNTTSHLSNPHHGSELRLRRNARRFLLADDHVSRSLPSSILAPSHSMATSKKVTVAQWETSIARIECEMQYRRGTAKVCDTQATDDYDFSGTIRILSKLQSQQLVFSYHQMCRAMSNSILPPTLKFRNTKPRYSLIFIVAQFGSVAALRCLLDSGVNALTDLDEDGRSLLAYALGASNVSMVQFLLEMGADVDAFEPRLGDRRFYNPMLAHIDSIYSTMSSEEQQRQTACIIMLVEKNVDPTYEISPLYCVFTFLLGIVSADVLQRMMDSKNAFISPNMILDIDKTPLLVLSMRIPLISDAYYEISDKFVVLLSRGANARVQDEDGRGCLSYALFCYGQEGADGKQNNLDANLANQLKDILTLLITAGADVYGRDRSGRSCSGYIFHTGVKQVWREALVDCGYDPDKIINAEEQTSSWSSGHDAKKRVELRPLLTFSEYLEIRKRRTKIEEIMDSEDEDDEDDEDGSITDDDSITYGDLPNENSSRGDYANERGSIQDPWKWEAESQAEASDREESIPKLCSDSDSEVRMRSEDFITEELHEGGKHFMSAQSAEMQAYLASKSKSE